MPSTIVATTTNGLVQTADNSGVLQLASGTGNLVTIPSVTGTAMVSGNMPAFSAYKSGSNQSFSSVTMTKVTFDIEEFDTNNNFSSSTFTPTVAGYYQVSFALDVGANSGTLARATGYLAKNGSAFKIGAGYYGGYLGNEFSVAGSALIYFNGSTDYTEVFIFAQGTSPIIYTGQANTYFQAVLVRSA